VFDQTASWYSLVSAKDWSAADLVVGEIDHAWGMGLGLGRRELPDPPTTVAAV